MFERFTDRARRVVVLAQEEARLLHHGHIGTEHLLLGLLGEHEGIAAQALTNLGISPETARQEVERTVGRGTPPGPSGHIPFTPRAKKTLELALREALQLGHSYIGTEHILLGLLREGKDVGSQVLVKLGADLALARSQVVELLGSQEPRSHSEGGPRRGDPTLLPSAGMFSGKRPELRRVIALGNDYQAKLPTGGWLTPLTLELWSTATELRFALTPLPSDPLPSPGVIGASWTFTDDRGGTYPLLASAHTSRGGFAIVAHRYAALLATATEINFAAPDDGPSIQVSLGAGPGDQATGASGGA